MNAIIIGGSGFIGGHVTDALLAAGWGVTVYDLERERYRPPRNDVRYIQGDLSDVTRLREALTEADVVFHLVSTTIPQTSNEAPVYDIESNLINTVRLLELCVQAAVGKVVFLSSGGTVYGKPQILPLPEAHPLNPICSYGVVKMTIEKYLHLFHHLYGLPYVVLRASNPYGRHQNPLGKQGAVAVFLGQAARNRQITIWGDGEIIRDYFHVSDLARACVRAAGADLTAAVLNIGGGRGVSLNQLIEAVKRVVNKPVRVERLPARVFDVHDVVLDIREAGAQLGWSPVVSLDEGLADTWAWVESLGLQADTAEKEHSGEFTRR